MNIDSLLENRIQNLMENNFYSKSNKNIVFFKGFPTHFFSKLKNTNIPKMYESFHLNSNGYIDVEILEQNSKQLISSLLSVEHSLSWGYFEELLALCNKVNDIHSLFDGNVIVVTNNLYGNEYPLELEQNVVADLSKYFMSDNDMNTPSLEVLTNYYCSVSTVNDDIKLVSFVKEQPSVESIEIDFFERSSQDIPVSIETPNLDFIHVSEKRIVELKMSVFLDTLISGLSVVIEDNKDLIEVEILYAICNSLNLPIRIYRHNKFSSVNTGNAFKHLGLLKKYWGNEAEFRNLKVYKNPEDSNEIIEVSQGEIVSTIIDQSVSAQNFQNYGDVFITAPTGAGKSLLFQVPAMFLAESELKAVTIVITPLIALMRDQVENLQTLRGIQYATFINSEISFDEKEQRISGIKNGDYSIVYLSPELLMANAIDQLIGERKLGLIVIDEAHLVTTWGRDFRADYWYLGDYLEKLRKSAKSQFPVVALTATAVYMGQEDMVEDTQRSLNLKNCILYLGSVRRENISFKINRVNQDEIKEYQSFDDYKNKQTIKRINEFVDENKKTVCYFPYARQAQDVFNLVNTDAPLKLRLGKYYGSLDKMSKLESQEKFRSGEYKALLCTKAFGMGVDVPDIDIVYHYAPTGNLTDYVQEIGRAARKKEIQGLAITDYTDRDLKYVKMLYGLSGIKQYQLKEMIGKLYRIFTEKKSRNFLVSPDAFSYLFDDRDLDNKVKSGLLLIAKDLEQSVTFPVLIVRPKSMFTKNFVNVPSEIEEEFLALYGKYVKVVLHDGRRVEPPRNGYGGEITIYNTGKIYEIDMANFWEDKFSHLTFPQFKRQFFENELLKFSNPGHVSARTKLSIKFNDSFDVTSEKLKVYVESLSRLFSYFNARREMFTKNEFRQKFFEYIPELNRIKELPNIVLDLFVADVKENTFFNQNKDKFKFIQARRGLGEEQNYRIMNSNYSNLRNNISRIISSCSNVTNENEYLTFIPQQKDTKPPILFLSILLELFGLASYQIIGGMNTEIFIRVNDPLRLKRLAESNYSNGLLTEIERKRKRSQEILSNFMTKEFSDEDRWNLIEDYFLGKDEEVNMKLGL